MAWLGGKEKGGIHQLAAGNKVVVPCGCMHACMELDLVACAQGRSDANGLYCSLGSMAVPRGQARARPENSGPKHGPA